MKNNIFISLLFLLLLNQVVFSQTYAPILTSGYTLDAVAENTTSIANTGGAIDGSDFVLYSASYGSIYSIVGGIPNNGLITNAGYSFQLRPYNQPNALYIITGQTDSLIFTNPMSYSSLSLLGFATEGSGTINIKVRFTDNSIQIFNNLNLPDWFTAAPSMISGFGRCSRTSGIISNPLNQPLMYNTNLNLTCANRLKSVARVVIQNISGNARIIIMGASGSAMPSYSVNVNQVGCIGGANGSASIVATNGLPPYTYTWSTNPTQNSVQALNLTASVYSFTLSDASNCSFSSTIAIPSSTNPPLSVMAISSSTSVCSGNTATLSGGGAITYTWFPGNLTGANVFVNPLTTTIYTVIGSSTICSGMNTITIVAKSNPTINTSASSTLICAGAQVTLTAFGASSYTWQSGPTVISSLVVSPIAPTAYQVSGTNSLGCTSNSTQVVIVNPSPIINVIASETLICAGGSSTLTASGGSNYTWNFGPTTAAVVVSPTANTVYSVTSAGVGCNTTQTISVDVFTQTLTVSNSTAICMGSSITLNASGGTTYLWSNGGTGSSIFVYPSVSTLYTVSAVTVINNMSCNSTGSVNLTINPNPTVTAVLTRSVICRGESTILTANGANTYVWNNTATTQSFVINPIINTNYTVTGTNLNGCKGTGTVQVKVNTCTGISELSNQNGLKIYPNPNNGEFTIELTNINNSNITITNVLGQIIKTQKAELMNQINLNLFDKGIYFINVMENNQSVYRCSMIKE
jgi:hypothetical protein